MSFPLRSRAAARRVAHVVPALLAGALTFGAAPSPAASAAPVAAARPAVAAAVPVPATCRTAVTVVRPDGSLALGAVRGAKGALYPMGVKLAYTPTAVVYLGTSSSAGVSIDRHYAIDRAGALHLVSVVDRTAAGGRLSLTDAVLSRGWGSIRSLTYAGPYLYGLTTTGGLKRYTVGADHRPVGAGTVATRGWSGVTSLGYAGWWKLPGGKAADDLVGANRSGGLVAYVVPRATPTKVSSRRLAAKGWQVFSHVAVGECSTGSARPLVGITRAGDVRVYLDANGNDQSGADIRYAGRAATGWTGVVAD